jgi:hypothetical protein
MAPLAPASHHNVIGGPGWVGARTTKRDSGCSPHRVRVPRWPGYLARFPIPWPPAYLSPGRRLYPEGREHTPWPGRNDKRRLSLGSSPGSVVQQACLTFPAPPTRLAPLSNPVAGPVGWRPRHAVSLVPDRQFASGEVLPRVRRPGGDRLPRVRDRVARRGSSIPSSTA